ncbi:hypothetical protein [Chitinophaga vietnamensis]|uniref:hypothetical protein n=1 Tax=Chitinophaga vietnamensis TaxID=2593957 RepID=UPI00117746BA|nr:hypothetical protein [Chitinophaga vietnamensis]
MTHTTALVTAARRYCDENYSYWAIRYAQERTGLDFPDYTYTDNDYNIFPRYNILGAIRAEVETLTAQAFNNLDTLREKLITMARAATAHFSDTPYNAIEAAAIEDEKNKFIHFISAITTAELEQEPPLPHRRRITGDEKIRVMQQLLQRWNYDADYWDPVEPRCAAETLFLPMESLTQEDLAALTAFLRSYGEPYLVEIEEDRECTEIEYNIFTPTKVETACFDHTYRWLIYGSHEMTVTFAGAELLAFIRQQFAGREALFNSFPAYQA